MTTCRNRLIPMLCVIAAMILWLPTGAAQEKGSRSMAKPEIQTITPTRSGYTIRGEGFGRDPAALQVQQGRRILDSRAVDLKSDTVIQVRSRLEGRTTIRVRVGRAMSNSFIHAAKTRSPARGKDERGRNQPRRQSPRRTQEQLSRVVPRAPGNVDVHRLEPAEPGPFYIDAMCNGQFQAEATEPAAERRVGVSGSHEGGVQRWWICAKPGWVNYQWSLIDVGPAEAEGRLYLESANQRRARLVLEAPLGAYEGRDPHRVRARLRVQASGRTPDAASLGLPGSPTLDTDLRVVIRDVPEPLIREYWIDEYRPGRSGALTNEGILDPHGLAAPDPTDGIVTIRGRMLHEPPAEIFVHSFHGQHHGEVLERTTANGDDLVKVRFSNFRSGQLRVRNAYGGATWTAKRFSYQLLDSASLEQLMAEFGEISIVVGDPVGQGSIIMGEREETFQVPAFDEAGSNVNVVDMHSSSLALAFVLTSPTEGVTLRLTVDFETAGEEIAGTFASTVPGWACGSFRIPRAECESIQVGCFLGVLGTALQNSAVCLNGEAWSATELPGPSVAIGGHLTSPSLKVDVRLRPSTDGLRVVNGGFDAHFEAGLEPTAAGVGLPLGPLEAHILERINAGLLDSLQDLDIAEDLTEQVNGFVLNDNNRIRSLLYHQGRMFVDLIDD